LQSRIREERDERVIKHFERCMTEVRGARIHLSDLEQEDWDPHVLLTEFGMLRVGRPSPSMFEDWGWAPHDSYIIGSVVVLPGFRGSGLGKVLMKELLNRFGEDVLALIVDKQNAPAHRLYVSCGFAPIAETDDYFDLMIRRPNKSLWPDLRF
jgi:ribosomal protein S18 acetylase RimI-like enzyme